MPSRELPWLGRRFVVWATGFASSQRQAIAYRVNYSASSSIHGAVTIIRSHSPPPFPPPPHHLKMPSASNQKRVKVPSRLSDIRIRVRFLFVPLFLFFSLSLSLPSVTILFFLSRFVRGLYISQAHILTNGCCGLLFGRRGTLLLDRNYRVFLSFAHSVCNTCSFSFFLFSCPPPLTINCSIWLRRHSRKPRQEAAESPGRPHASMDCVRQGSERRRHLTLHQKGAVQAA